MARFLLRSADAALFHTARLLPRKYRFAFARDLATGFGPLLDGLFRLWRRRRPRFGSAREYALAHLLGGMDARRLQFDLALQVSGLDELQSASRSGRGVLLLGTHTNAGLVRIALRSLDDAGIRAVAITDDPAFPICGSGRAAETISPKGSFLVTVRSRLRSGAVVCALLDSVERQSRNAIRVDVRGASTWIADPLIQVALRWGVPLFYFKAGFQDGSVSLDFAPCSLAHDADDIVQHYPAFLSKDATPVSPHQGA